MKLRITPRVQSALQFYLDFINKTKIYNLIIYHPPLTLIFVDIVFLFNYARGFCGRYRGRKTCKLMQFMFMALRQIYIYKYLSHEIKFSLVIYVFSFKPIIAGIIN